MRGREVRPIMNFLPGIITNDVRVTGAPQKVIMRQPMRHGNATARIVLFSVTRLFPVATEARSTFRNSYRCGFASESDGGGFAIPQPEARGPICNTNRPPRASSE